jgi:hypothetical protein
VEGTRRGVLDLRVRMDIAGLRFAVVLAGFEAFMQNCHVFD